MTFASPETENFLSRLEGVRKSGSGWIARCPCRNDDNNPSLSIGQGEGGRTLVTCHRGMSCGVEEICTSVGLKVSDLMPKETGDTPRKFDPPPPKKEAPIAPPQKNTPESKPKLVTTYDYVDEYGALLFQKMRYVDENGKKSFRQRKPNGFGGWEFSLGDVPKVLYNLPAVLKAKREGFPIWLVEGEKDADTLTEMGLVATTMPGGAGKWLDIHTEALSGALVEIISDKDEVGIKHAKTVCDILNQSGCDAQVWASPDYKDITDHLSAGLTLEEIVPVDEIEDGQPIPEQVEEEKSLSTIALEKMQDLLLRDDLSNEQKLTKSHLILTSANASTQIDSGRLVQWNDFLLESTVDTYDWVIPSLLERSERVIVVAAEGVGKTMLARQIGLLCAAGVHPFTFQPMPKVRTLMVDLENPERIIRRTSRDIAGAAMAHARTDKLDAHLLTKPSGLDLLKASDRALLEETLDTVKPDILLIGPLYKAFLDPGGRTSESIALEVAKYLDMIRVVYKCALWIEHHAPLGTSMNSRDLRPFGSAVWSRWPEFGLSLQPDPTALGAYVYDVRHFRGARDSREWPTKMKRGVRFPFETLEWTKVSK
jgi:hypothetical protein